MSQNYTELCMHLSSCFVPNIISHNSRNANVYVCKQWKEGPYLVHQTLTGQVSSASAAWNWEVPSQADFQP